MDTKPVYTVIFMVPFNLMGLAIGRDGTNITQSRKIKGVLSVRNEKQPDGYRFTVIGESNKAVKEARCVLEFKQKAYTVPQHLAGRVIGKNGNVIKEVINNSLVKKIETQNKKENAVVTFNIIGSTEAIQRAVLMLNNKMDAIERKINKRRHHKFSAEKRTSQSKLSKREQAIDCQLHNGESIVQSNSSFTENIQFEVQIFCTKKKKAKAKMKMKNTNIETNAGQIKMTKARVHDNGLGKYVKVAIKNQGENEVLKVHTSTGIGDDRGTCISLDTPVISNEKGENRFQKYIGNGRNRRDQQQYLENSNQEIKDTWEEWDYDEESSMGTELEQFKMDETRARSNCLCNSLTNQLLSVHGEAETSVAYNVGRGETGTSDVANQLSFIDS